MATASEETDLNDCSFCAGLAQFRKLAPTGPEGARGLVIAELPASVALLSADQYYRGYSIVMAKSHATELFHLPDDEAEQFVRDMRLVAKAIAEAFQPRKMNYELLGNTVPHLHWHVVPRHDWDLNPTRPIWELRHEPVLLDTAGYEEVASAIQARLAGVES